MVLFTKYGMDEHNPVPVVNIPPVRFIGGPKEQKINGNIYGAWYTDILVSMITTVGVPVEEALLDIIINPRR